MTTTPIDQLPHAERYRTVAARFSRTVDETTDWDAPTPVPQWTARDVVDHLTTWVPALVEQGAGVGIDVGSTTDPPARWHALDAQLQGLLDDPERSQQQFTHEHIGTMPLDAMLDRYCTVDVFLHAWDLARAGGLDDRLDPHFVSVLLGGMSEIEPTLRASGQFGEHGPVPEGADEQDRLIALIGRDPRWTAGH